MIWNILKFLLVENIYFSVENNIQSEFGKTQSKFEVSFIIILKPISYF